MSMLPFEKDTDLVYNRNYKVCYYIDDKRIETGIFTNKLINIDNTYFWFSSIEYGLAVIRQDMVVYMGCVDEPKNVEKVGYFDIKFKELLRVFNDIENLNDFELSIKIVEKTFKKYPFYVKANIITFENIFSYFEHQNRYDTYYDGIKLIIDNSIKIGCVIFG